VRQESNGHGPCSSPYFPHLPDRVGYLWLKTRSAEAIKLSTSRVEVPEGEEFRTAADRLRQDATLGGRLSRAEYLADITSRDREWLGVGEETEAVEERWEKAYRQQETICQE
jgi:hypothetical protein